MAERGAREMKNRPGEGKKKPPTPRDVCVALTKVNLAAAAVTTK